ncbi:unnamed protein product [Amoebophrya sp. A25]|nr:unnamed protein product [Amoebophrya sp. A25]|eukprot:GSA25T00005629001.1
MPEPDVNSDDYYKVLGLERGANEKDIAKAYKKAALRWHPDKNPTDKEKAEENFKKVTEAYEVLNDKEKRDVYDRFGKQGLQGGGGGPGPGGPGGMHFTTGGGMSFQNAESIFRQFFGNMDDNPFDDMDGFGGPPGFGPRGFGRTGGSFGGGMFGGGPGVNIRMGGMPGGMNGMPGGPHMGGGMSGSSRGGGKGARPHGGPSEIPPGQKVTVVNVRSQPQHNDQQGTVREYDKEKARYIIELQTGTTLSLKAENLSLEVDGCVIKGLQSKAELNNQKGKVLKYDAEKDRYTVQIFSSNQVIAVPVHNVVLPKGTPVQIVNLTGASQYNTKWGTVVEYEPQEERYTVQLTKDRSLKIKRGNCRCAG